jgi:CDP-diacylglycerol--glycerol-3-phosphate 3-phosphatidyltransferase
MNDLDLIAVESFESPVDLACSCAVFLLAAMVAAAFAFAALGHGHRAALDALHRSIALPRVASTMAHWALDPIVRHLVALDVSANAITGCSLAAGIAAGFSLAIGHFGVAGALLVVASLGDALDGLVARSGHSESPAGALFDASVDRYEEFFSLGGLAIYFRESGPMLALVLTALMGSFMVSYGSAKAEALRVPVPAGAMRRAERATCLCLGTTLVPLAAATSRAAAGPAWVGHAPLVLALVLIAGAANVSAVRRIRAIARRVSPAPGGSEERVRAKVGARAVVE